MGKINFTMTGLLDQGCGGTWDYKCINCEVWNAENHSPCFLIQTSCLSSSQNYTWCCLRVAQSRVMTWLTVICKAPATCQGWKGLHHELYKDWQREILYFHVCLSNVQCEIDNSSICNSAELQIGSMITSAVLLTQNCNAVHVERKIIPK